MFEKTWLKYFVPHYIDRLFFSFYRGWFTPILCHIKRMSHWLNNPKLLVGVTECLSSTVLFFIYIL